MAEIDYTGEIEEFEKRVVRFLELIDHVLSEQERIQKDQALESKSKREMKINKNLQRKLSYLRKKDEKFDNIRDFLVSSFPITDSDKQRLHTAKEMIEIAKNYTGVRWDYSAPDGVSRGYIKNRSKMMLESFDYKKEELSQTVVVDKLWKLIESSSVVDWNDLVES